MKMVDDVLSHAVKSIAHLITQAGLINVDFADVRAIMEDAGTALMGMGQATGENRAKEAATMAIESPLLEISIDGAKGILFNVIGGKDLGMFEVDQAAQVISEQADNDANIIFGATIDPELGDELRITVLATGFDHDELMSKQASYNNLKRSSSRNRVNNSSGVQTSSQSSDLETQDNSENQGPSREMNHKKSPSKRDASYKSSFSENMIDDSEEEDLDTPSFLRRKKEY
jgi:cell division protein FtsZ